MRRSSSSWGARARAFTPAARAPGWATPARRMPAGLPRPAPAAARGPAPRDRLCERVQQRAVERLVLELGEEVLRVRRRPPVVALADPPPIGLFLRGQHVGGVPQPRGRIEL